MGIDHGWLFQERDRTRRRSDQLDYDYFKDHPDELEACEMVFARRLKDVLPRLAMRGYDLAGAQAAYEAAVDEAGQSDELRVAYGLPAKAELLSFEEYIGFIRDYPLATLDETFIDRDDEREEKVRRRFRGDARVDRLPGTETSYDYSEKSYFKGLVGCLDCYSMLWALGQCSANLEAEVVWDYGPLCENGWESAESFTGDARRRDTFLIATEGSSDAQILDHALRLLRPEIADFFRFIDVSERHPFSGTGSLVKFAEGLVKIDVQNQMIFVFDNDAEGREAFKKMSAFRLPPNMSVMLLPDMEAFRSFPARGPEGVINSDINGRAAAIECYLDLELKGRPPASVTWTNYKRDIDTYQGSLDHKETYMRDFLQQTAETVADGTYNATKICGVLDALVAECHALASAA